MVDKFLFLREHQFILSTINIIGFIIFGIILAALVIAIDENLKSHSPNVSRAAAVFGFIWSGLVISAGMIANIGLNTVLKVADKNPDQAQSAWIAINAIVEGIGGGNEIVGGIWVSILSFAILNSNKYSNLLAYFGFLVGSAGILTIYSNEIFTQIFGLTQIIWFVWIGTSMLHESRQSIQPGSFAS